MAFDIETIGAALACGAGSSDGSTNNYVDASKIMTSANGSPVNILDASGNRLEGIDFYGESKQDGTPTPTSPQPIESTIVNQVVVCGKNLLPNNATTKTENGITFDVKEDKSVLVSGTSTHNYGTDLYLVGSQTEYKSIFPKGNYIVSGAPTGTTSDTVMLYVSQKDMSGTVTNYAQTNDKDLSLEVKKGDTFRVFIRVAAGKTANNLIFYPMIRPSFFTDGTYEPYQSQTVNLSAPIELNGFGGVKDSIEIYSDGTGKYIQRIGKVVVNKNTQFNTLELPTLQRVIFTITNMLNLSGRNADVLSSHFVASIEGTIYSMFHAGTEIYLYVGVNNATDFNSFIADKEITFYYPVAEPIETALPTADADALKALHSYKPNTVVMNDADAEMTIYYEADAKAYIDNKFNELAKAILNE